LSALGDIAIASPQINLICENYVTDNVYLLTEQIGSTLFQSHPKLKTIILNPRKIFGANSLHSSIKLLKQKSIEIIYDFQGNKLSKKIVTKLNPPVSVGTQPETCYTNHPEKFYTREMAVSVFDRLNETLLSNSLTPARQIGNIYIDHKIQERIDSFKDEAGIFKKRFFCMHAGSANAWPSKRWPKEFFFSIAKKIEAKGVKVIWIGAKGDKKVNTWLSNRVGFNATNMLSPVEVCGLAKDAIGALANDSGPMHLFATSNIPVFGFFGPTSPYRSHALGQKDRTIYNKVSCSPCYSGKCKKGMNHKCLTDIHTHQVWEKITSEIEFDS